MLSTELLKQHVAIDALAWVKPNSIVGVGTGSTTNYFIDALFKNDIPIQGAVSSSKQSTERLREYGIKVFDLNEIDELAIYIDGADEVNPQGELIKGGGGALTREKIVAAKAKQFICIVDKSKCVDVLGAFPLPVEIIPMASTQIQKYCQDRGGKAILREGFVTDNGNLILDVHNLTLDNPSQWETELNQIPGIVTVGIFAQRKADVVLVGSAKGVASLKFKE